ncbi:MAG: glucohydrolase [Flavobacteriaceae bacterium]|nr:glucohydrolase [Flavobacteriaceae bacterium]|tara:strand:- start:3858 stop:5516 length:1659 start_codon:yes stop_codon:yes gene_type:complete
MNKNWWKESVVYQIYPRSYKDTSGNGLGDIDGIIQKIGYIKSLGVDIIWLCPIYESPNDDNGYDISDYRRISDDFGGDESFDRLLKAIHNSGLKLIMDLVVNHTSDEHYWFDEAKKSKGNKYHNYYIWKKGNSKTPPNNWQSVFGGSAWKWNEKTKEYFLHLYTQKQPDLNWENSEVREEIYSIIDFWLDKGVDGFRMDVISMISKRLAFEDIPDNMSIVEVMEKFYSNGPRVHEFIKEMNQKVLSKYDIVTVGEGPGINLENALKYVSEKENELNMVFHFDHLFIDYGPKGKYDPIPIDFIRFKKIFSQWDNLLANKGWNSIFLGNHDFSRIVSRFGNDKDYHFESAKLLVTLLMTMRGTPYIYQGDEIGMINVAHPSIDFYDDVETLNAWKLAENEGKDMERFLKLVHKQSRDNARTPMQWDSSKNGGFTKGKPWIPLNKNFKMINVTNQEGDPHSILQYYRKMIAFRKANKTLVYGEYKDLEPNHSKLFIYKRWDEKYMFLVAHNFSNNIEEFSADYVKDHTLSSSNYLSNEKQNFLQPWESRIYFKSY